MAVKDYLDPTGLSYVISKIRGLFATKTEVNTSISNLETNIAKKGDVKTVNGNAPDEAGNLQITATSIGAVPSDTQIVTVSVFDETLVIENAAVSAQGVNF